MQLSFVFVEFKTNLYCELCSIKSDNVPNILTSFHWKKTKYIIDLFQQSILY